MEPAMMLPPGRTCGDCQYFNWCNNFIGDRTGWTHCDWLPSRFREAQPRQAGAR